MDEQRENLIKSLSEKENIQQNRQVPKPPGLDTGSSGWNPPQEEPQTSGKPPGFSDAHWRQERNKIF